jgi:corrinoid protein of di/trimethylamine methyltransferase
MAEGIENPLSRRGKMSIEAIYQAIMGFDEAKVKQLTHAEIDAGTDLNSILNDGMIGAMDEVGKQFSEGILFVPEMLMAAQAMKGGLEILKPHLSGDAVVSKGTVVIGTVKGDLHDIGKNLVAMMMEGAGFEIIDLGPDVDADRFVQAAKEHKADIVALSALLTTTMPAMEATIAALKEAALPVKTIIGGAPVTQAFADQIKADGYSDDAPGGVELVRRLMAG